MNGLSQELDAPPRPPTPADEAARIAAVRAHWPSSRPVSESMDRLAALVAERFQVPFAAVSLIDAEREWFVACNHEHAVQTNNAPRPAAFCAWTVALGAPLVVEDTLQDPRFAAHPKVLHEGVRFYAGYPIFSQGNLAIGALCIRDIRPRRFTDHDITLFTQFGRLAQDHLQLETIGLQDRERARALTLISDTVERFQDAVIWADENGIIQRANAAARLRLGRDTIAGAPVCDISDTLTQDKWREILRKLNAGDEVRLELPCQNAGKDTYPGELRAHRVTIDGLHSVCVFIRDVTQQHNDREQAEEAARAKGMFLANMSHEIRTPLNGIVAMIDLLTRTPLNDKQQRYAHVARSSADVLKALVDDILDFSKLEAGKVELEAIRFDPADLMDGICEILRGQADSKKITLRSAAHPDVPRALIADPTRIRQILINLVSNAVKFTATGGVVLRCVLDTLTDDAATIRFSVSDTGIGIPQSRVDRLFQPFVQIDATTTRRFGGTGLGLAICRQLADIMGGDVGVESVLGEGSTFWVTIPCALPPDVARKPTFDPRRARIAVVATKASPLADAALALADQCAGLELIAQPHPDEHEPDDSNPADAAFAAPLLAAHWHAIVLDPAAPAAAAIAAAHAAANPDHRPILLHACPNTHPEADDPSALERVPCDGAAILTRIAELHAARERSAVAKHQADQPNPLEQRRAELQGSAVLLAEDNEINQEVALEILAEVGITPVIAKNGAEAAAAAATRHWHAILMDCQMPEVDGFEATRRIRAAEAKSPAAPKAHIIALTANAMQGDKERCLEAGMNDYLTKPLDPQALYTAIARARAAHPHPATTPNTNAAPDRATSTMPAQPNEPSEPTQPLAFDVPSMLARCMGKKDLAARLLGKFADLTADKLAAITAAHQAKDAASLRTHAHALKGAAANLSALQLAEACKHLEHTAQTAEQTAALEHLDAAVNDLRRTAERALADLPRVLADHLHPTADQRAA